MRVMNWNIEWMNNWFQGGATAAWRQTHTGIASVSALAQRVASVIGNLDPDVLTIQEGPSDPAEMALFLRDFLSANGQPRFDAFGGLDGGSQKLYALVKRGGALRQPQLAGGDIQAQLFDEWQADVDGDAFLEPYQFTRNPLVVEGTLHGSGEPVRIVSLHTKSKFVNEGAALWNDPNRRQEFVVAALKNRRRISTEAMRTRNYLDRLFTADPDALIVVTGDFNDGPGIDFFELNYLTHGVADIIQGSLYSPERQYRHALVGSVPAVDLFTARFDDFVDGIDDRPVLLDHVLVSPALAGRFANARIAHAEYEAQEDATRPLHARDRRPSDHRPIVVEIG